MDTTKRGSLSSRTDRVTRWMSSKRELVKFNCEKEKLKL